MKFLIFMREEAGFYQIDNQNVTQDLIDKIANDDAYVMRFNQNTNQFEEYVAYNREFSVVENYEDDEDSYKSRTEILQDLLQQ